ncbi:hypothetical protein CHS0354_007621 [Potamilus streckersoni]|uniref:CARD domain-containing protein n=1 Tax=Potamilus streckersoni TaxID=2493646 RepID=A0AAE0T3U2_9BIVA|nr:hypothetical protein CHS0354_007621 [Potamilus streckersoni]
MEMEDNNSDIFETQPIHKEKYCTCIESNTTCNNIEEHDATLDQGILHSLNKGNGGMPSASVQGTFCKGQGDSFVMEDISNNEKADGPKKKRRKHRVSHYRSKRTKSTNTSKMTEIDEFSGQNGANKCIQVPGESYGAMMLKRSKKSAFEIVQKSSPVSCILTMTPETVQKEFEEFISPDSGLELSLPWSNSLEKTPSSGFESCTEYGRTPTATKRGNAIDVEERDLKNIIDEQTKVDLVRKLQRNYIKIKREIDISSGLADELYQAEIIMEQDYEKVRSARDIAKRSADLLLKAIAYNITPLKLKKFIYCLRKCNYDYIADLLQNNPNQNLNRYSDLSQFSNYKSLQRKLGKLRELLLKDFDPKYVIDELLEMEVISFIDHEDIWNTQFNEQRIDCVLKCVKKNIEINLGPFCCILRKHSEWLAEKIDLLSSDQDSSGDSDANAALELSCKKGRWTGHIEGSFESIPNFNIRIELKTENAQSVDNDVVRRLEDSANLSLDATLLKIHFKCDRADKGSIIVRLQPLSIRALKKLKDSKPEDVVAILKCILTNEDLKKLEAAKLTSIEIKIEALDTTLPNPISLKEEGITKEAIVEHFTYLSTCVPNIKEFIPAFLQDDQISDESKTFLKQIISMKGEDRNEAFLRFLLQEESGRSRIIFKRQLRKMKEISILRKLGNRNEIVLKDELGKDEIQMNYSYLIDELDGREFLKIFSEKGFFNEEICDKILRSRNRRERTQVFINFVLESKYEVLALFFQELEYKHRAIYYVLTATKQASKPSAESQSMLVAMKAAICERYDEVIGETEPKAYRDAFVERKIFTDQEFEELVKICPRENRAAAFLKLLLHGNNIFALKTFLWVLKRTGNEFLANSLENDFYMYDGEEVNLPGTDCTNKCTLMTAVLEAQIIIGKESQSNCAEDEYQLLEYPLECWDLESIPIGKLLSRSDQKVINWMHSSGVENLKLAPSGKRNYLSSAETSTNKTIFQANINDNPRHSDQNVFNTVTRSDMAKIDITCAATGTSAGVIEPNSCSSNQYKKIPPCRIRRSLSYQSPQITNTCNDGESNDTRSRPKASMSLQTLIELPQDTHIYKGNDSHESNDSIVTLVPSPDVRRGDACSERHSNPSPKGSSRKSSSYSQAASPVPISPIYNSLPCHRRRRRGGCGNRRRKQCNTSNIP